MLTKDSHILMDILGLLLVMPTKVVIVQIEKPPFLHFPEIFSISPDFFPCKTPQKAPQNFGLKNVALLLAAV
ncbi:MAG: hypothetical protein LBO71_09670 [Prevotellaceae bacterium]|jgi:hypothetical protein|nr:hypothetical protein [Prevotellaceae bacterium]